MRTAKTLDKNYNYTYKKPMTFFVRFDSDKNVEYIGAESRSIKSSEIWMARLYGDGSIQNGYRPVFVISNNKNNQHSTVVNVIPLTTKMNKKNLPCHVELTDYKRYGLTAPSTILVEQTTTIQKENLKYYIGEISDQEILAKICDAMKSQFPVLCSK